MLSHKIIPAKLTKVILLLCRVCTVDIAIAAILIIFYHASLYYGVSENMSVVCETP